MAGAPQLRIVGGGINYSIDIAGDASSNMSDGYSATIPFRDEGNLQGQTPHPKEVDFQYGQFDSTSFSLTLFSGITCNGRSFHTGAELGGLAQNLFSLAMPDYRGGRFIGPPPMKVAYGRLWSARGFFHKVRFLSQGGWDKDDLPTIITLELEFQRHFGRSSGFSYGRATDSDLQGASFKGFRLRG